MSNQIKQELGAVALDLKRVAEGFQSDSPKMSDRFAKEAKNTLSAIATESLSTELRAIKIKIQKILNQPYGFKRADDALTYSSILLSSI